MSKTTITPSLRSRVLQAGGWTMAGHAAQQSLRLCGNLILTRLLVPEVFGIMALAQVLLFGLQLLSDLGLRQNIVQSKRGNDPVYLNTVWTVQIIRGTLIWLAGLLLALALNMIGATQMLPPDSVYSEPVLPALIAVLSINALINGFESTKLATASRALRLGVLTKIELLSQATGLLLMVVWVMLDRSIWGLAAGSLLSSLLRVLLGNLLLPGDRNKLHWDRAALREIIGFGKWIFATSILGFLASNGDRLLLSWLTNAQVLGLYAIAFFLVGGVREIFVKLIGNVAYPALSEIARERPQFLKQAYYRFRRPLDITSLLSMGLLFTSGHLIVDILYDDRYATAGPMLEILCIGLFEIRFSLAGQCFVALGKPRLLVPIIGLQLVSLYLLLPLAYSLYGLNGALWIAGGSVLFTLPLTVYFKIKNDLFDLSRELRALPWLPCGMAIGWLLTYIASAVGLKG
jgi:O-antigen/teichoic acid export membrane protein